ncbi:hypothetical protein [Methanobacterium spitsbergense]|uniref:Uncharacterized protein n=1 Tax=Methanobacterium spitsbergense TaxID=2874285 RepID=A0A8T5UZW7_9EURY|nr:hypothetical protein [Methanobacterium spitsbergense]MBZ2166353.1 hypothetical protein [Methanobacterium spitsbergense]
MMRKVACSCCSNHFNRDDDGSGEAIKCPRCKSFCYFVHPKENEPVHVLKVKEES